ncbi:MAG: hypothetical protein ACFB0C_10750 [Leptolyngbyaceae cyanobacterium]
MLTSQKLSPSQLQALDHVIGHIQRTVLSLRETLPQDDWDVVGGLEDIEDGIEKLSSFHQRQGQP